jgi:KWG repeat domain protein
VDLKNSIFRKEGVNMIIMTEYKQKCLCSRKKTVILIFILLLIFSGIVVSNLLVKTNAQWEWIIKPGLYKNIAFLDGDLFKFHKNDKEVCIIDASTKEIFEYPLFDDIEFDRENVFIANKNSSFFHVDKAGNKLSDKTYESIHSLKDGFSAVKLNGLWGFIDENFNQVIDFKFYDVYSFYENYAAVMDKDNKWGFIDTAGNVAIDFQYDEVENFREDLAAVRQGDKWGYIDKNGKEVISCKYDEVHSFSEGLAAVAINNYLEDGYMAWAYIDAKGEVVIPFYSYSALGGIPLVIGDFHDGRAFVTKDLVSVIGKNGENIFSGDSLFFISKAEYYKEHSAIIGYIYSDSSMKIKKYGLLNLKGEEVLKPVFDYIESIYGEYMIVADIKNGTDMNYGIVRIK